MNPAVLLSLIHDLQAKVMQLYEANVRYEERIKELESQLTEKDERPLGPGALRSVERGGSEAQRD